MNIMKTLMVICNAANADVMTSFATPEAWRWLLQLTAINSFTSSPIPLPAFPMF